MAKVRRKIVKRSSRQAPSIGMIALIIGGAIIVVVVILALAGVFGPKTVVAGDPQGLAMCGNIPCPTMGSSTAPVTMIDISSIPAHVRIYLNTKTRLKSNTSDGPSVSIVHPIGFEAQRRGAAQHCVRVTRPSSGVQCSVVSSQSQFDPASPFMLNRLDLGETTSCEFGQAQGTLPPRRTGFGAGVNGTPTFFINGKPVEGAHPPVQAGHCRDARAISDPIEAALKEASNGQYGRAGRRYRRTITASLWSPSCP
jgi:hypothetical protein